MLGSAHLGGYVGATDLLFPRLGLAQNITVNSTGDGSDPDTTDGVCQTATPGECTLRAAIQQANAMTGTDTIAFNIPGAGPHTIAPATQLPTITDPVIIDGYTQPGAVPNSAGPGAATNAVLKIELSGADGSGPNIGLKIETGNSTVRGLVINRFFLMGIGIDGAPAASQTPVATGSRGTSSGRMLPAWLPSAQDLATALSSRTRGLTSSEERSPRHGTSFPLASRGRAWRLGGAPT